jgi:EAL domain-containing protein (putative c-di-GMP-specific phosphodiesterase class I)/cellobiose-specific phosphotransferase system component IIC
LEEQTQPHTGRSAARTLRRLSGQRHLSAVKGGLTPLLPLLILGSFARLLAEWPVAGYQAWMVSLFGPGWAQAGDWIRAAFYALLGPLAAATVASALISWYRTRRLTELPGVQTGLVAAACFLLSSYPNVTGAADGGLGPALLIALAAAELMRLFAGRGASGLLAEEPDRRVRQSFELLRPSVLTLVCFAALRLSLAALGAPSPLGWVAGLTQSLAPQTGNPWAGLLSVASTQLLGLFGLHSAAAGPQNVLTAAAGLGGVGASLCLIAALCLFSRRAGQDRLAKIAILPGLFHINDLLLYGLPLVFNPVYAVPFVLAPLCMAAVAALAVAVGYVPAVAPMAPVLWGGYQAAGGLNGVFLQLFCLTVGVLVYRPFVKLAAGHRAWLTAEGYEHLRRLCEEEFTEHPGERLIQRDDDAGRLARLLAADLKRALDKGHGLYYLYQPLVDGRDGRVVGAEELLRWNHPEYGHIAPMITVALAEEMGLSARLGQLALTSACLQLSRWREQGAGSLYISVNITAAELKDPAFAPRLRDLSHAHGVAAGSLQLEVTETMAVSRDAVTRANLDAVRSLGFGVAIDDFGTGHASLATLQRFPFSALKVDKSLSREVVHSPERLEIIASLTQLCRALGIGLVVEYVETDDQLSLLRSVGCQYFQGYRFGAPMSADAFPHTETGQLALKL